MYDINQESNIISVFTLNNGPLSFTLKKFLRETKLQPNDRFIVCQPTSLKHKGCLSPIQSYWCTRFPLSYSWLIHWLKVCSFVNANWHSYLDATWIGVSKLFDKTLEDVLFLATNNLIVCWKSGKITAIKHKGISRPVTFFKIFGCCTSKFEIPAIKYNYKSNITLTSPLRAA